MPIARTCERTALTVQHPGVDPRRQAAKDKRDKDKTDKKKGKRAALAWQALAALVRSRTRRLRRDSDCSDCSDQSVYDDEHAVSVQAADVALASLFSEGSSGSVDVAAWVQARVAHRPQPPW